MKRFNGEEFVSLEEERLYSTGDTELDELLEKAFCEGYEYAQREFGKLDWKLVAKREGIDPSKVTKEMVSKFRQGRKELTYNSMLGRSGGRSYPENIDQLINNKVLGISHGGIRHSATGKRLREGTIEGAHTGRTLIKDIGDIHYDHGALRLPKREGGNEDLIKYLHKNYKK